LPEHCYVIFLVHTVPKKSCWGQKLLQGIFFFILFYFFKNGTFKRPHFVNCYAPGAFIRIHTVLRQPRARQIQYDTTNRSMVVIPYFPISICIIFCMSSMIYSFKKAWYLCPPLWSIVLALCVMCGVARCVCCISWTILFSDFFLNIW